MIKDFQTYTFNNGEEETNLYFFHTDHLGSTNYLTDKEGVVQQSIVYQPYGEVLYEEKTYSNPYKFNGKELDTETGLAYYGARYYSPELGVWYGVDPLMEKYPQNGAYVFCNANPIKFVDLDGRKVFLTGEASQKTFEQLSSSTKLKLSINESGQLDCNGKPKTIADKLLMKAIQNEKINVEIFTTNDNFTESGKWFVGGAFNGSSIQEDGTINAKQIVNPSMTEKIDQLLDMVKGVSMLHEVIEAYIGALDSPGANPPTFKQDKDYFSYVNAHNKATSSDPRLVGGYIYADSEQGPIKMAKYDPNYVPESINKIIIINDLSH